MAGTRAASCYGVPSAQEQMTAPRASLRSLDPARRARAGGVLPLLLALGCAPGGAKESGAGAAALVSDLSASVDEQMGSIIALSWTQSGPADVHAEYSFDEGEWLSSPTSAYDAGDHRLLLLGVPFDTPVTWRLVADDTPVSEDASVQTGPLPDDVPAVDELSGDRDRWDAETRWLLLSIAPDSGPHHPWTLIVDRQGRVVWAHETPQGRTTRAPRPSYDGGEILVDYNSWWTLFDGGAASQVLRLDIEGQELGRWDTPGLIHPYTQLADGRLAWSASQSRSDAEGELLVVQDADGEPATLFDCSAFSAGLGGDICAANALWWDPDDGHFLYSLFSLDTVIEVDEDGAPLRWFGALAGAWGFADPDTQFWWQHGAQYLGDGHLLLSARRDQTAEETVVREYALDEADETLEQVWTFGEDQGVYARVLGEARRLANGDTLHNYGSAVRVREVTEDGEVVWEIHWSDGGILGATWPLSDLYAFQQD